MVRSPRAYMSVTARSERPIRRWISMVRPPWPPPAASRRMRSPVERGSMPYSAVIQPWPEPFSQRGTPLAMRGGADHVGVAHLDQARALGVGQVVPGDAGGAQLVGVRGRPARSITSFPFGRRRSRRPGRPPPSRPGPTVCDVADGLAQEAGADLGELPGDVAEVETSVAAPVAPRVASRRSRSSSASAIVGRLGQGLGRIHQLHVRAP